VLTRVMAPLAPLLSEEVWRGLTGGRSVHLTDWPTADELPVTAGGDGVLADADLVRVMDRVREVCSVTLGLRKANALRVRQPLRELRVAVPDAAETAAFADLIAAEVNVKSVRVLGIDDAAAAGLGVQSRLAVNARAAGPRLGRQVQGVLKAAKAGDWEQEPDGGAVVVRTPDGPVPLEPTEYELTTVVSAGDDGEQVAAAVLPGGGVVVLATALDDALIAEGRARDVVRAVQDARKAAGLDVSDRVRLTLGVPAGWRAAVEEHRDLIAEETLATALELRDADGDAVAVTVEKDDTTDGARA
jgi:isoleucyl-tRNA synthetase